MPPVSLVVCVYRECEMLRRLLGATGGCYDDLVVVHDGEATGDVEDVVVAAGGRLFQRPHHGQQEPHWPFAWAEARHDWILRLDADEYPSAPMVDWLRAFRALTVAPDSVVMYRCIWPLWNGRREITMRWPNERAFLFDKQRVSFVGMVECVPQPDGFVTQLPLVLHHRPSRPTVGFRNVLFRKQAYVWRRVIAENLIKTPTELPNWRLSETAWPVGWEQMRQRPLRTGMKWFLKGGYQALRQSYRFEGRPCIPVALNSLYYVLLGITVAFIKWRRGPLH